MQKYCLLLGLASIVSSTSPDKFPGDKQQPNSLFNLPEDTRQKHSNSLHPLLEANRAAKLNGPFFEAAGGREKQNVPAPFRPAEAVREKLAGPFKPAEAALEGSSGSSGSSLEREAKDGLGRFVMHFPT